MVQNYIFVDGNYLRTQFFEQMIRFYGSVPPIDFHSLRHQLGGGRCYYYDAINYEKMSAETDLQQHERVAERQALHRYINTLPNWHVRDGYVRRGDRKKNEQKAVDVQLAVDALEHAARGNVRMAVLLTGDLDFEPLLSSLERMGVQTNLWHVHQSTAPSLVEVADESHKITLKDFHSISAPSFRANYRAVEIHENAERPSGPVFAAVRSGTWGQRDVVLFRPTNQSQPRLYLERGNEPREPSLAFEYPDIDKLEIAFSLTLGQISWTAS